MRNIFRSIIVITMLAIVFQAVSLAAPASTTETPEVQSDSKVKVALLFVNNAKATYDKELNDKMTTNFDQLLANYEVIPGQRYIELLNKNGISDITTAERSDITEVFKGEPIDYVLYVELQPFIRKEKVTMFTYGIDMTAIVPVKIIDLKNNKYLYNGKFTEFAADSSMIGIVGNKSVSMKALDKVIEKMNAVIKVRLPLTKEK